jgi:hypothetical protein
VRRSRPGHVRTGFKDQTEACNEDSVERAREEMKRRIHQIRDTERTE